jgi:hypothetical protein
LKKKTIERFISGVRHGHWCHREVTKKHLAQEGSHPSSAGGGGPKTFVHIFFVNNIFLLYFSLHLLAVTRLLFCPVACGVIRSNSPRPFSDYVDDGTAARRKWARARPAAAGLYLSGSLAFIHAPPSLHSLSSFIAYGYGMMPPLAAVC